MVKKVANKLRANGQIQDKDRYIPISEAKKQMVAILKGLQLEIECCNKSDCDYACSDCLSQWQIDILIQEKINALKGE